MAYCRNCGSIIDDKAVVCPKCGVPQTKSIHPESDTGSLGWGILGFFLPVVGLILFLIWKEERPKSAKAAGIGALASVAASMVVALLYLFIVVLFCSLALSL